jgi:hypothetical protein
MTMVGGYTLYIYYMYITLKSISILFFQLRLPKYPFLSGFPTKIFYAFLISPVHARCLAYIILYTFTSTNYAGPFV